MGQEIHWETVRSSRWVVLRPELEQKGVEWRPYRQNLLKSLCPLTGRKVQVPGRGLASRMACDLGLGNP